MISAMANNPAHPYPPNMCPTPSARALVTPASLIAVPSRSSPPCQMKISHPVRSPFTSSQLSTPVRISVTAPISAVTVTSILVHDDVNQNPHTTMNTTPSTRSPRVKEPIARSSLAANADASGVCLTLGGFIFITTHGTTSMDTNPGTIAASIQLAHVT